MTDLRSAARQALEALEFMADEWGFTQKANRPERWQAIDALRAALEQPKPCTYRCEAWPECGCAALEQPERTLTDEVIADLWHANGGFHHHFARAVERYLKGEK
jgi:hypothetical protein